KALHENGTLERYGVELIGADYEAIDRAEDRARFRETMTGAGLRVPRSTIAQTLVQARAAVDEVGLPFIVRPAFTLGGTGGGGAPAEANRQAVPGAARPGDCRDPRGGRADGRIERAVRVQPWHRRGRGDRDEPARFALERARQQGDRVPDRQDRGAPGGRVH